MEYLSGCNRKRGQFMKIFEIFTRAYREETAYQEMLRENTNDLRLTDDAEIVGEKIKRLGIALKSERTED